MDSPVISPEAYKAMMAKDRKLAARIRQRKRRPAPKAPDYIRRRYGLSLLDVVVLWESQDHKCPGCGKEIPEPSVLSTRQIHIDRNRLTKEVRGVLCSRCSVAIGMTGDSIETLERLLAYLKAHKGVSSPVHPASL